MVSVFYLKKAHTRTNAAIRGRQSPACAAVHRANGSTVYPMMETFGNLHAGGRRTQRRVSPRREDSYQKDGRKSIIGHPWTVGERGTALRVDRLQTVWLNVLSTVTGEHRTPQWTPIGSIFPYSFAVFLGCMRAIVEWSERCVSARIVRRIWNCIICCWELLFNYEKLFDPYFFSCPRNYRRRSSTRATQVSRNELHAVNLRIRCFFIGNNSWTPLSPEVVKNGLHIITPVSPIMWLQVIKMKGVTTVRWLQIRDCWSEVVC